MTKLTIQNILCDIYTGGGKFYVYFMRVLWIICKTKYLFKREENIINLDVGREVSAITNILCYILWLYVSIDKSSHRNIGSRVLKCFDKCSTFKFRLTKYILRINSINDKYVHVDASQISGSRKPDNNQQSPLLTNRPEARSDLCHYLIHKLEQATTILDFKLLTTII